MVDELHEERLILYNAQPRTLARTLDTRGDLFQIDILLCQHLTK
jgi:hypothetical protein